MNNGKICVSVCAKTADETIQQIERAEELADIIEIRFDCLDESEIKKVWSSPASSKDEICTFRPKEQGGKRSITEKERLKFWNSDDENRWFKFWNTGTETAWADFELDLYEMNATYNRRNMICSHHDFNGVPENLSEIYNRLKTTNADVLKIAVQADDITDSIAVWKLLERAKSEKKQIIPIAMGEAGKWTRILGLAHGAFMTYAALENGSETAPGQISARDLIETYRARELDEQTAVYGIVGGNTSYSMSPYMHNAAFAFHDLNAVFVPFQVKNLDEFIKRFVRRETREIELNLKGFSVTIPHKQEIIKHLDFVHETARKIGAVNTVKIVGDKLHGYNTDARGFIEPLKNAYGDLKNAKVGVIGNGGAARACVYALQSEGAKVTIYARDARKAKNLADEFDVAVAELGIETSNFNSFDVVVNATPLGTFGELEAETPATAEQIKSAHLIYDLIYNPFETLFLREAKSVGVPTIGGSAMLVAQAMEQFTIWTMLDASMKEMSRAALRKIKFLLFFLSATIKF
jgi:3-dehydroquinate dehydratase/shikimate dehydrogenase